jgi:HEAT repeat protein
VVQADPELVVPALMKYPKDHGSVRDGAAMSLWKLGSAAKAATPALTDALKDPNSYVRWEVVQALKAIDPETTSKAGE